MARAAGSWTRHVGFRLRRLWQGTRKPTGLRRDLERLLLSFPRSGREVKWVKAVPHADARSAAFHGVFEQDRLGNAQADAGAQKAIGNIDRGQTTWRRFRQYASAFRNFL
eukprot:5926276-Amphidinium_carterae.3